MIRLGNHTTPNGVECTFSPVLDWVVMKLDGSPIIAFLQKREHGSCHVQFLPEGSDYYGGLHESMSIALVHTDAMLLYARTEWQAEHDETEAERERIETEWLAVIRTLDTTGN